MKILLVQNDANRWATTLRAEALKKQWLDDEVDISNAKNLPAGDKYDVIHFLYSGKLSKQRRYILKYKDKVFTTLASQRTLDGRYDKLKHLIEIYQQTVCCVTQNPFLGYQLMKLIGKDNVVYIPNGVDEELFNRKFVVGFVGAKDSMEHKGFSLIKKACDELGLELIVKCGDDSYEKMRYFYNDIKCLALASLSEGCNNPTLEALAMNIPVISTAVGIASELEGVTIVDRDVESIKQALRKLSGRIQILEKYTWEKIAKKYHNLYEGFNSINVDGKQSAKDMD